MSWVNSKYWTFHVAAFQGTVNMWYKEASMHMKEAIIRLKQNRSYQRNSRKKACTGELGSTKSPGRLWTTAKVDEFRIRSSLKGIKPSWAKSEVKTHSRRWTHHCQSLHSRCAFINVNTNYVKTNWHKCKYLKMQTPASTTE